ncbi:hypothetical protein GCM10022414_13140 [Zhongshania borealis]|uniref:Nucleotidyl transferase domain-containing protein n=1 Tax=Zhongshania borealis TaxID=889488 RepID=A0ABP7WN13_9GAMM
MQAEAGSLVIFGIVPESAHTGYGYIQRGSEVVGQGGAYGDSRFVEKPNAVTAQSYCNSGMFLFAADVYLNELKTFRPDIYTACEKAFVNRQRDKDFLRIDADAFMACPDESIDYAVMEKTDKAVVVPLSGGRSDVGAWSSLWEIGDQDASGNVSRGDVLSHNTVNSYIRAEHLLWPRWV